VLRSYLNDMPYCDTASKPLFQTSVTSQALVAESRQERKAETALPPTEHTRCVSASSSSPADMASVGMVVVVVVREERDFRLPISAFARYSCTTRSVGNAKGVYMSATCRGDGQGGAYLAHVPERMRSRGVLGAIAAPVLLSRQGVSEAAAGGEGMVSRRRSGRGVARVERGSATNALRAASVVSPLGLLIKRA